MFTNKLIYTDCWTVSLNINMCAVTYTNNNL